MSTTDFSGNIIRPFQLESSNLRGRIVRFNNVLDDILTPHNYPEVVNQLLAETITLCSLLSSMLKYEGIFTLQTQGDGPISMLVVDMTSAGEIRGCASFDEERLKKITESKAFNEDAHDLLIQLLGKGYIAFTVDQGLKVERYQGIVELRGNSLVECAQHYFTQSEQINTAIILSAKRQEGTWRSAGLMLQHMPSSDGTEEVAEMQSNLKEDDWRRSMILMQSCKEEEMLSSTLTSHDLLMRLFHEEGIRVFEPMPLINACRCSEERVENIVMMMPEEDRKDMVEEGEIMLTCEFCSKGYRLDPAVIEAKVKESLSDTSETPEV